jgi:hypothetical protein
MGDTMNGHEHNRQVAFTRMWGAIAAQEVAKHCANDSRRTVAQLYAQFEMRRYAAACYAFSTTLAAMEV